MRFGLIVSSNIRRRLWIRNFYKKAGVRNYCELVVSFGENNLVRRLMSILRLKTKTEDVNDLDAW